LHVDWAIPSRYVDIHGSEATIVGAGADTYTVTRLPATIHVVLAIRLLGSTDELRDDLPHLARNRVRDPRGALIGELGHEFRVQGGVVREGWLTGLIVRTRLRFQAGEEGTYMLEQEVDGDIKALPIHVVHEPLAA
jgi:hypothetical protein